MAKFTIDVLIKGSTNMAGVAAMFKKSTDKITGSISKVTKVAKVNKKAIAASTVGIDRLSRALGIGLVAAFAAVAHAGSGFEVAVADLSALTGIVGKDLAALSDEALVMSRTFGVSGSNVAGAMKLVASAKSELIGVDGAIEKVTESALLLSKASRVDLVTSTKVLTTAMNQFNLGAEEATRVINVLAVGSKLGASEIADTGQAILRAGVAARVGGVSFEETNAALQVLAKGGLKGVIAGTQFKTMLLRMMQSTDNLNPKIVGLSKAFENLALANLNGAEYAQLFGLEAMTAGIILTEQIPLLKKWTKAFTGTNIAFEQAEVNMATLWETVKRLGTAVQFFLIKTFNKLSPVLTKIVSGLTKFLNLIAEPPNLAVKIAIITMGVAITTASWALGTLIMQIQILRLINWWAITGPAIASMNAWGASMVATNIGAMVSRVGALALSMGTGLVSGVTAATLAVKALSVALFTTPVGWIILGIAALVGVMVLVIKKWDEWGATVAAFMGPFGTLISLVVEFKNHWADITQAFKSGGLKDGILAIGKTIVVAILKPMERLLDIIAMIPGLAHWGDLADTVGGVEAKLFPDSAGGSLTDQAAASIQVIPNPALRQQLDVNMKIDAEGRPTIETTESTGALTFNAELGFTNALAGV
jgi:TP901 family phage tail tape measure protein